MLNTTDFAQQKNKLSETSSSNMISPTTIARGGGVAMLGLFFGAILQYGYNLGIARFFGPAPTGQFIFALSLISIAAIVGQLGAQELLLRYFAAYIGTQDRAHAQGVIRFGFTLGIVGSTITMLLLLSISPVIAQISGKPEMVETIRQLTWLTPLLALINMGAATLQAAKRMGQAITIREIGRPLAISGALFGSWLLSNSFAEFNRLTILLMLGIVALGYYWLRHEFWPLADHQTVYAYRAKEWLGFSFSVMFMDIFRSTAGWLDTLVLGFFVSATDIAIYFAAVRTALLTTLVLAGFNAILAPLSAGLWHQQNLQQLEKVYRTTTRWTCMLILPITVTTILVRQELMSLFGENYAGAGMVLLIIILGRTVNGLTGGVGRMLMMTGHERVELFNTIVTTTVMIIGMAWAANRFGMVGVAVVSSTTIVLANLTKLFQVYWFTGLQPYSPAYLKLIPATLVSFGVGTLCYGQFQALPYYLVILFMPLVVLISFGLVILLLGIEPEDRSILRWNR